jgi:hypothetical protein
MSHKLIDTLERDIRNQVLIDQMKKLTRKGKFMVFVRRINWVLIAGLIFCLFFWIAAFGWVANAWADEMPKCPDPGVKCKVLFLNAQEEQILMTQNGILDTAAQGRALELGQFSVYLKTRIGAAPQGEVRQPPAPPAAPAPAPTKEVDKPAE